MTTRLVFVTILWRETPFFGDETPFSSPFCGVKLHFLATRPFLVATLKQKTLFFDDETRSRHHFEP
ncbi:hypothetical protein [Caldibacillus thermoamylovorans]|uniref:hypothetical protein n=1 Tax=Caldibacillus thermoamylovorans TaxID=35841 RepID=UPI00203C31E8|nr:hypothetical protein [Caldibacillus thermoamylovorans]MCM3054446.1 hypothetical protein [Caldibacillus thermoamylovorans]